MLRNLRSLLSRIGGVISSPPLPPPDLPYRCGTILRQLDPEKRARVHEAWDRAEDQYVDWVLSHPNPKREWLQNVERVLRRRADVLSG